MIKRFQFSFNDLFLVQLSTFPEYSLTSSTAYSQTNEWHQLHSLQGGGNDILAFMLSLVVAKVLPTTNFHDLGQTGD